MNDNSQFCRAHHDVQNITENKLNFAHRVAGRENRLIDRRSMKHSRDSVANDAIDLGSDHRAVVARIEFPGPTRQSIPFTNRTGIAQEPEQATSMMENEIYRAGKQKN